MFGKLFSILSSRDSQAELLDRIRGNPRTTFCAVLCAGAWGAAKGLEDAGYVIASGLCYGAGAVVAIVALLLALDKPKDDGGAA